jgi:hypothetical protein
VRKILDNNELEASDCSSPLRLSCLTSMELFVNLLEVGISDVSVDLRR